MDKEVSLQRACHKTSLQLLSSQAWRVDDVNNLKLTCLKIYKLANYMYKLRWSYATSDDKYLQMKINLHKFT